MKPLSILSIAGSDNSSGAGIQADVKTAFSLGSYCLTAVTTLTSQNSKKISMIYPIPVKVIISQISSLLKDYDIQGIKIGLITDKRLAKPLYKLLKGLMVPIVIDPIFEATTGKNFLKQRDFLEIYSILTQIAEVITPNYLEACLLGKVKKNSNVSYKEIIRKIYNIYNRPIILTGGNSNSKICNDLLLNKNILTEISSPKINTNNTHGSGCSFSTAITVFLAKGYSLIESMKKSKKFVMNGIKKSPDFGLRYGPIGH
mgnify:CR=1 FL=1